MTFHLHTNATLAGRSVAFLLEPLQPGLGAGLAEGARFRVHGGDAGVRVAHHANSALSGLWQASTFWVVPCSNLNVRGRGAASMHTTLVVKVVERAGGRIGGRGDRGDYLSGFLGMQFDTNGATLDFSKILIGQETEGTRPPATVMGPNELTTAHIRRPDCRKNFQQYSWHARTVGYFWPSKNLPMNLIIPPCRRPLVRPPTLSTAFTGKAII